MSAPESAAAPARELSRREVREALRANETFIVDRVFPSGSLHIITGPSGIGKTTWLLPMMREWAEGRPILGHASHPCDWVYVALDRGILDTDRTMRRLNIHDWDAPVYSMEEIIAKDSNGRITAEPTIFQITSKFPNAKLIVLEGLQGFLPNTGKGQSQNKADQLWCMQIRDRILNKGKTIIAVNHSPKSAEYANDRENMLGSQALIGAASTIIRFDTPLDPNTGKSRGMSGQQQTDERLVTVMGRDFPNMYLSYSRASNGAFELDALRNTAPGAVTPTTQLLQTSTDSLRVMDAHLIAFEGQAELSLRQIRLWARENAMTDEEMYRWINNHVVTGRILKEGSGRYRRSESIQ